MTIGYSTHWPKTMGSEYAGKPNFFPQKIIKGLPLEKWGKSATYSVVNDLKSKECGYVRDYENLKPKLHTFREDSQDRWKVGMKIHPVINNRTKNRFQFAPEMVVKGIQKVEIIYSNDELYDMYGSEPVIKIDDRILNMDEMEIVAVNDGFKSLHQFCHWFRSDWSGKIIHWTDLKY